jgi:hypothetical protein
MDRRLALVGQFKGTADPLKVGGTWLTEGDRFSIFNRSDIDRITTKHEKEVDRALASLFAADPLDVRFEPLAESFRFTSSEGSQTLAVTLAATVSSVPRRGIDSGNEIKLKTEFARCFRSDEDLSKVIPEIGARTP